MKFPDCQLGPRCCQLATSVEVGYIMKAVDKIDSLKLVMRTQNNLLDRRKIGSSSTGSSNTDNVFWVKLKLDR